MKIEERDRGNREVARRRGKEAEVKSVSPRTETRYKADGVDELAQHSEVPGSMPEVKRGVVRRNNTSLPGETSSRTVTQPSLRGVIPDEGDEESAEVIVMERKPGALPRPWKRRDRKS